MTSELVTGDEDCEGKSPEWVTCEVAAINSWPEPPQVSTGAVRCYAAGSP